MAEKQDQFVGIAAVISVFTMIMLFFTLIFDAGQLWVLIPIVGALALMGIALGYFSSKPRRFRR